MFKNNRSHSRTWENSVNRKISSQLRRYSLQWGVGEGGRERLREGDPCGWEQGNCAWGQADMPRNRISFWRHPACMWSLPWPPLPISDPLETLRGIECKSGGPHTQSAWQGLWPFTNFEKSPNIFIFCSSSVKWISGSSVTSTELES